MIPLQKSFILHKSGDKISNIRLKVALMSKPVPFSLISGEHHFIKIKKSTLCSGIKYRFQKIMLRETDRQFMNGLEGLISATIFISSLLKV